MNTNRRSTLIILFITILVDLIGFGILLPVLPLFFSDSTSTYYLLPAGTSSDHGYLLVGFLIATYSIFQFFGAPILGQLSDRYGRRWTLIASLASTAFFYFLFAAGIFLKLIWLLFLARAINGFAGGNWSIAQAAIADITTPQTRVRNFGLIGAALGMGLIFGPYLGALLSNPEILPWFGPTTPFLVAGLVSVINVGWVIMAFPETLVGASGTKTIEFGRSLYNVFRAFEFRQLRIVFLTEFIYHMGFALFLAFLSIFLMERFQFNQTQIAHFFSYIGVWIAVSQGIILRRIATLFSEYRILRFAVPATAVFTMTMLPPSDWRYLVATVPLIAVFNGFCIPTFTALVSRLSSPKTQGQTLGINASVIALAQAVAPALSGLLAARASSEAPIVAAVALILLSGFLVNRFMPEDFETSTV